MISSETIEFYVDPENKKFESFVPNQIDYCSTLTIDHVDGLSYEKFFKEYLLPNKPCIFSASISDNWRSRKEWVLDGGQPNFDKLELEFGTSTVPVADCDVKEYNSQLKHDMLFKDYILYWRNISSASDDQHMLYLKDWHFNRYHYKAYVTPEYFTSDWLNEFCIEKEEDDYQFVYMGPQGTWTPLHADVFGSYSWSANVCGRKRWLLFPPGMEIRLGKEAGKIPYSVDEMDLQSRSDISYIDIIQEVGEIIFVPSGWYHQVWNLDDVISINHNWFNGCNLHHIWKCLSLAALDVEAEISDCKGFDGWKDQVQLILKVHHGMNYEDFMKILNFIFHSRSVQYQDYAKNGEEDDSIWHSIMDIIFIRKTLTMMLNSKDLPTAIIEKVNILSTNISNILQSVKLKRN